MIVGTGRKPNTVWVNSGSKTKEIPKEFLRDARGSEKWFPDESLIGSLKKQERRLRNLARPVKYKEESEQPACAPADCPVVPVPESDQSVIDPDVQIFPVIRSVIPDDSSPQHESDVSVGSSSSDTTSDSGSDIPVGELLEPTESFIGVSFR